MRAKTAGMLAVASLVVGSVLAVCSSGGSTTAGASTRSRTQITAPTSQSERTAIQQVRWTSNVTVSFSNGSWTFRSDGIPSTTFTASHYAVPANPLAVTAAGANVIATSQVLSNQNYNFTLPTTPQYSSETTTNLGAIGVMMDGAVLYNPYEANKETVATADNFSAAVSGTTASFLDTCDGHPGPGGQYHYHGLPDCLVQYATTGKNIQTTSVSSFTGTTTAPAAETNSAAKKPVLLGFAFDGYGIYDNVAMGGKAIPVSSLDACNGIFSPVPGYPHGIYHYVLENVKTDRSSISCYHGVVSSAYTRALKDSINAMTGKGPPSSPPPSSGTAQELSTSNGPDSTVGATAKSLAANKTEIVILTFELKALGTDDLC